MLNEAGLMSEMDRVHSTLRYDEAEAEIAAGLARPRKRIPAAQRVHTNEKLQRRFVVLVSTYVALEFDGLLISQQSVSLQRIWSSSVDATNNLALLRTVHSAFSGGMPLPDEAALRLWAWVECGGMTAKAVDIYEGVLAYLEDVGFSVPAHRGGDANTKRGRVTKRA